jgi:hypothetical protein
MTCEAHRSDSPLRVCGRITYMRGPLTSHYREHPRSSSRWRMCPFGQLLSCRSSFPGQRPRCEPCQQAPRPTTPHPRPALYRPTRDCHWPNSRHKLQHVLATIDVVVVRRERRHVVAVVHLRSRLGTRNRSLGPHGAAWMVCDSSSGKISDLGVEDCSLESSSATIPPHDVDRPPLCFCHQ